MNQFGTMGERKSAPPRAFMRAAVALLATTLLLVVRSSVALSTR
jgi:hypothetical protein